MAAARKKTGKKWAACKRIVPVVLRWSGMIALLGCVGIFTLRFVNPPFSALMIIRSLENRLDGKKVDPRWEWRPLEQIPKRVQQAIVTSEDARFMQHWGIDISSVWKVLDDHHGHSRPRGASTITMQTVKNQFLWPGRSYVRKGLEVIIAPMLELLWGKRRILEIYLNIIEFGEGVYGIEAAARSHFRKSCADLSSYEAASLAALLPSPRRLSPDHLTIVGRRRLSRVLREAAATAVP